MTVTLSGLSVVLLVAVLVLSGCEDAPVTSQRPQPEPEPEPQPAPDLVTYLYSYPYPSSSSSGVLESLVAANGLMYISATITNIGDADAPATTVRLYRSDQSAESAITASDKELWKAAVPALRVGGETWTGDVPDYAVGEEDYWHIPGKNRGGEVMWNVAMIAPSSPGTVFYWLCVDPVPGEVDRVGRVSPRPPASAPNCRVLEVTVDSDTPSDWPRSPFLIADSDPSTYTDLAWVGENRIRVAHSEQSPRSVYVYEARYADQQTISVMVDQGFARSRADDLATFYARRVGQLPARSALDEFVVLVCCSDTAAAYANRGRNRVAIFHRDERGLSGRLGGTMLHEYAHLAYDGAAYASANWRAAVAADDQFITAYAREFPNREDVAESYVAWFAVRCSADRLLPPSEAAFLRSSIPARLAYFDDLLGGTRSCPRRE